MFNYPWIQKPDYRSITKNVDYNKYWDSRTEQELNPKLKRRERIAFSLIKEGEKVLDLGCGNSLFPVKLKEAGVQIKVGDISDEILEKFSEKGISTMKINLEDISDSELGQNNYIVLFEVLEHLRYPEETMQILKKHTDKFLITVPNSAAYYYRLHLMFGGRFLKQWVYHPSEHLRYWSHTDFLDWLDALDLTVTKTYATSGIRGGKRLIWLQDMWMNLFADQVLYVCEVQK